MKKLLFGFLAIALGLVSCSQDIESPASENPEIKLTTKINPATRGTNTDEQSTAINMGQHVGITITGATADHKNVSWTVGSEGKLENQGDPVYYNGDNMVTITAYHPYNEAWTEVATGTAYTFNLASDQSGTGYADSDLLFAQTNAQKTTDAISLTFNHKLAKVSVFLTNSNNEDLSGAQIFISNTSTEVTFGNGQATATGNQVKDILAGTGNQAAAIIAPQTLTSGTEFVKVVWNGKNFYYTLPADKPILAGTAYTYRLRINNSPELNLDGSDIDDWNKEDNEGEMNEKIPYLTFSCATEQPLFMTEAVSTLEYSLNGGAWQELGTNHVIFGGEYGDIRFRGKSLTGTATDSSHYSGFVFDEYYDADVVCSGDIRTLIDYQHYKTVDTSNARFISLFSYSPITTAPLLPATNIADKCYYSMFEGCARLTKAPELPATSLKEDCYSSMFYKCTNLINAPELPAKTLVKGCYGGMFWDCTSLTKAPELPATTLANYCYNSMFKGCTNLSYIKMMATDISATYCLNNWITDVASNGTLLKNAAATWNDDGIVPSGWQVAYTDNAHNGYGYVDLGLSTLWAIQNVGAENVTNTGDFYAWGETAPKQNYDWSSYNWANGGSSDNRPNLIKYNSIASYGYNNFTDNLSTLENSDDAAYVNMGSNWRTPTQSELNELLSNCTWTWTQFNGVSGYKVQSKMAGYTNNYIFLPVTGCKGTDVNPSSTHGYLTCSELSGNMASCWNVYYSNGNHELGQTKRHYGYPVRAVSAK